MSNNTKIKFKRSELNSDTLTTTNEETLEFGEPLLIDTDRNIGAGDKYLILGPASDGSTSVNDSIFFRGFSKDKASRIAIYNDQYILKDASERISLKVSHVSNNVKTSTSLSNNTNKYHLLCCDDGGALYTFQLGDGIGIYIDDNGVLHGAAWNDYAEKRNCIDCEIPGMVVCETGDGKLKLSTEKMQPCSYVISDTYGTVIGDGNVAIAVSGKVLVYTENDDIELGDCLTAGPNGKAVKMTRQEITNYPDRILGIVTEIPTGDFYNDININGRVWIKIK